MATVASLVQVLFMGLVLLTSDLPTMTHGILLQPPHDPLFKSARNLGILLSSAGNDMIKTLPIRLSHISFICLSKTLSPMLLLCWVFLLLLTTLCGTQTTVLHTIPQTTPLLTLTRIPMTTLTQEKWVM